MKSLLLSTVMAVATLGGFAGQSTAADAKCCNGTACCDNCPACCKDCCGGDCCGDKCCDGCPACCN